MPLNALTAAKYNNVLNLLDGDLSERQLSTARRADVRNRFIGMVDSVRADDAAALKTAHDYATKQLGEAAVGKILNEINPGLAGQIGRILGASFSNVGSSGSSAVDLARAFENVDNLLHDPRVRSEATRTLREHDLTLTEVAYADGIRTYGVSGPDIADVRLNAFRPNPRRRVGEAQETATCPIVKDSNWTGPFGVIDLAAFSVKNKNGRMVSLKDVLEDPARHINGYNGPDASFFDGDRDEVRRVGRRTEGPKAAVMDALVPAADGHTDTVPSIYTYGAQKLVLVIVPGEGISAHYSNGRNTVRLPLHDDGREKALRITRQQFSDRTGPTSFDRGTSVVDDMPINSALIVQIPVVNPDERPPLRRGGGGFALESLGGAASFAPAGATRGGGSDSGNLGVEAGVVSAGGDLGRQKALPPRLRRADGPIRADFVLYAATDGNVISDALARRMRKDMDAIIDHPACTRAATEN